MALCLGRRSRRAFLVEATLLALMTGTSSGDPGLRRSPEYDMMVTVRADNSTTKVQNQSFVGLPGPFHPGDIVDPFSDINCEEQKCQHRVDCGSQGNRLCRNYTHCGFKVCLHKQLFPMLVDDVLLFVTMFVIAVCAGAAGIGGGGLNVPALMMISNFGIKEAVPLSHAAVMGNSLAQLLFNYRLRHPSAPQRPLIHYELAILALPAQLGGNSLGVVIGRVFPPTLLIILSLVMLTIAATKTFMKGSEVYKKYLDGKRQVAVSPEAQVSLQATNTLPLVPTGQAPGSPKVEDTRSVAKDLKWTTAPVDMEYVRTWSGTYLPHVMSQHSRSSPAIDLPNMGRAPSNSPPGAHAIAVTPQDDEVKMRIPWNVILVMIAFNVVFCIDFLCMSPDVFDVRKCSGVYWVALVGLYPFVIASIWIGIKSLNSLREYHEERGDEPIAGDPEVNGKLIVFFPLAAVVIGLVAGLVGLGGGEFMVPLLLEFGLLPRVASSTSGFLILFATSSNIVHYVVADIMQPFAQYGISVFILAFLGAAGGLGIRDTKFLREHTYLLVFMLATLLTISGGLLAYRGFVMVSPDWSFKEFCNTGGGER